MTDSDDQHDDMPVTVWRRVLHLPLLLLSAIESVSTALDRWFVRLMQRGEPVITDQLDRADSVFSRLGRMIAFPFWKAGRLISRMVPRSMLDHRLSRAMHRGASAMDEGINRADTFMARAGSMIGLPFRTLGRSVSTWQRRFTVGSWMKTVARCAWLVWYPVYALGNFLAVLATTRPRGVLLWSIPMILVVGPILYGVFRVLVFDQQAIAQRYRGAVIEALEAGDFARAELFEDKLVQLGAGSVRLDYEAALRLETNGQFEAAVERMRELAPLDKAGFGAAHFWLARNLIDGRIPLAPDEALKQAAIHLEHARTMVQNVPEVEYLLAVLDLKQGRVESALQRTRELRETLMPAALMRLEIDLELGRQSEAKDDSLAVLRLAADSKEFSQNADANMFRLWATAQRMAGTQDGLGEVLDLWNGKFPDDQDVRSERASVRLGQLRRETRPGTRIDVAEVTIQLIETGQMMDRARRGELADLLRQLWERRYSEEAIDRILQNLESSGDTPGLILEQFGTLAIIRQDYVAARRYLELAVERDPDDFVAWNNLAFLLNAQFADQTERAITAADHAVRLAPASVEARETRGMILSRLERWRDAITDLEIALNGMPGSKEIHRSLSVAYRNIGNHQLAESHQRQASQ